MASRENVDIAIIGAGFSGLVAALLARQRGCDCLVVEKFSMGSSSHSNAHYLNAYSLEILVSLGLSIDELRHHSVSFATDRKMVFCHTLNRSLGCIDLDEDPEYNDRYARIGRFGAFINVRGTDLYRLLLQLARDRGVRILWEHRLIDVHASTKTIVLQGSGPPMHYDCGYLLACDGASGSTVDFFDLSCNNQTHYQDFITVECHGSVSDYVEDAGILYWIFHERLVGCMVAFDLDCLQVLQIPVIPGLRQDGFDERAIKDSFSTICGLSPSDCQHRFKIASTWRLRSGTLEKAQHGGWLFVLGDALHQVLPSGGLGLNLALADAYNLVWKLAEDLAKPSAGLSYSNTYEQERLPAAKRALRYSVDNYQDFFQTGQCLMGGVSQQMVHLTESVARQFNMSALVASWIGLSRQLNRSSDQAVQEAIEINRDHFDGMAMHNAFYYHSEMMYQVCDRPLTGLARMPFTLRSGMRVQNFQCYIHGELSQIFETLNYLEWTAFIGSQVAFYDDLTKLMPDNHRVYVVDERIAHARPLPLKPTQLMLVRPDRFVAVFEDIATWSSFKPVQQFLRQLFHGR